ncbi:MAG: homoserine dehydrogenase [Chloroflexi bacterium]|nr:homoserine dehydrogenase [Chloroflexota bacterium]
MARQRLGSKIGIGLLGLGVVGGGVCQALTHKAAALSERAGVPLAIEGILVRDLKKSRAVKAPARLLTTDPERVLENPRVDIVVELLGGEQPALEYIERALRSGRHVVTANKEVLAKHGPRLLALGRELGVSLQFEGSVGGGIPIIGPLLDDLLANDITAVYGIINGTTNYILTRMARDGLDFGAALKQAQDLGYAEADPSNDVAGTDAAYKLAILATLAFHTHIRPEDVYREGIERLTGRDFRHARELGYAIKLLAIAKAEDGAVQARVHPVLLPQDYPLAKVEGVFNAVQVEGDLVGPLLFQGRGAGAQPTASAVVADIIRAARHIQGNAPYPPPLLNDSRTLRPMAEIRTRYYIRLGVADRPGVLAQIARILGDEGISIASVIQKEVDEEAQTAELVIMTHQAQEAAVQEALKRLEGLAVVSEVSNYLRVED